MELICLIIGATAGIPLAIGYVHALIIRSNVYGDKKNDFKDLCIGGLQVAYNRNATMCSYDNWCKYNGFWAQDPNFTAEPLTNMAIAASREVPVYQPGQGPGVQMPQPKQGFFNKMFGN